MASNPENAKRASLKDIMSAFEEKLKTRGKLHGLTQTGTAREYVEEFTELRHEIPDHGDCEALLAFVNGLKPWARSLLQRRGVQDISKAITVAESLVEFSKPNSLKPKNEGKCGDEPQKVRE